MARIRTFIAVDVDSSVRRKAAELTSRLRAAEGKITWVAPQQMHLTVKFLGEVPDTKLPKVCSAVEAACRTLAPFAIECRGAGAFPDRDRPRTLWIGVTEGVAELRALHDALEDQLAPFGFPKEGRGFKPHLTIGRVRQPGAGLAELLAANEAFVAGGCEIGEAVVYASFLDRAGPTYEVLGSASLGG